MNLPDRFWAKVRENPETGCWEWAAGRFSGTGYAMYNVGPGVVRKGHRLAYESLIGPVPDGLDLDHLCRVRHCVNPWHMDPVTRAVNLRRGHLARRTA